MSGRLRTALAALVCLVGQAQASSLVAGADAPPIAASIGFCQRHPSECALDPAEPDSVTLDEDTRELLAAVNRHVNHTIAPVTDLDHWGVLDRWDLPTDGRGDCEDSQLLKRRILVQSGLPRRALRMTVVFDRLDQGHAVLTVRTDRGDLILDNITDAVLPWHETGYRFVKRERSNGPGWAFLELDRRQQMVAMAQ